MKKILMFIAVVATINSCSVLKNNRKSTNAQNKIFDCSLNWNKVNSFFFKTALQNAKVLNPKDGFDHTEIIGFVGENSDTMTVSIVSFSKNQEKEEIIKTSFSKNTILSAVVTVNKKDGSGISNFQSTNTNMTKSQFTLFIDSAYRILCPQ